MGSRPSDSNRDVHLSHAWTKLRPAKSEFPEAEHLCFSQSIIFLPLSLTNDLDDGLGLGHLALAMGEGELGTKDNVFLPWSLRDVEDHRLPGHSDRQTGHHITLDPHTWFCNL